MSEGLLQQGRAIAATWDAGTREKALSLLDRELTNDIIFARLGEEALGAGAMRDDLIVAGKRVYQKASAAAHKKLCGSDDLKAYADPVFPDTGDAISLLAVIASLVNNVAGQSLNALLVAALILRIGLRRLCHGT